MDAPGALERFLDRNPGLSLVARSSGGIVGAVLCGHDGRRGYLHHLAVASAERGRGIGRRLAEEAIRRLSLQGIAKCHLFVRIDNSDAAAFWTRLGWEKREDIEMYSLEAPNE